MLMERLARALTIPSSYCNQGPPGVPLRHSLVVLQVGLPALALQGLLQRQQGRAADVECHVVGSGCLALCWNVGRDMIHVSVQSKLQGAGRSGFAGTCVPASG